MSFRLFIAEKPSVARAIAQELGQATKKEGYIECGNDRITWCFGHLLEQAEPDAYTSDEVPCGKNGRKMWRIEDLPIIPKTWILKPKKDTKAQLKIIGDLLKNASQVVHAGDPDREGQLLVDEVLAHFNNTLAVARFWVSAQDSVSIQRGLAALKENSTYHGWADAARGRQRADWLIGMNLSRAFTLAAQRGGSKTLLTVGRVQTPTLALVVARDRAIENFTSVPYHTVHAQFAHSNGHFSAIWKPKEDQAGLDAQGRLIDTTLANARVAAVQQKEGIVSDYKQEAKKQNQPLAFALSDLTLEASQRYGYSAQQVLDACQALYETHKLTSYPRTDCAYLPESQYLDAPQIVETLRHINPEWGTLIDAANPNIKSKTWNDEKITAHHGIIPTLHKGSKNALTEIEHKIYELIVRNYLAQFYPVHEYQSTTVTVTIAHEDFIARGKVITRNGWKEIYQETESDTSNEKDTSEKQALPEMKKEDAVTCLNAIRKDAKTKPPARLTEGTLIRAMETIHQFVSDIKYKQTLREGDGIGTSATRASIISELKRKEFLTTKGKHIISTQIGRSIIDVLPEVIKNPVLTAINERMLKGIEAGTDLLNDFILKQEILIKEQVTKANERSINIAGDQPAQKQAVTISTIHKCMVCGSGLTRRPSTKKKGFFWWGCSSYPKCKQTYFDTEGRPDYRQYTEKNNVIN